MILIEQRKLLDRLAHIEQAIQRLIEATRMFFYELALAGEVCPWCEGQLVMIREGRCRCQGCDRRFDPTLKLQRCPACEGQLALRIRRYACRRCGQDVSSRFLFHRKIFDAAYFRDKMAESRQRCRQQRIESGQKQAAQRSIPIVTEPADLEHCPDLIETLNNLIGHAQVADYMPAPETFDLASYETWLLSQLQQGPKRIERLLSSDTPSRHELVRLFIAAIFLWHRGRIQIRQAGRTIEVQISETQRKGQAVPADAPSAHAES